MHCASSYIHKRTYLISNLPVVLVNLTRSMLRTYKLPIITLYYLKTFAFVIAYIFSQHVLHNIDVVKRCCLPVDRTLLNKNNTPLLISVIALSVPHSPALYAWFYSGTVTCAIFNIFVIIIIPRLDRTLN